MKKISKKRVLAWVVGLVVALPVLAYLGLVAVNWSDESPSADAKKFAAMYRDRPVVADADNGLVRLQALPAAGRGAAPGADVLALARACSDLAACEEALERDPAALAKWVEAEQALLEGYRDLLASSDWREEVPEYPAAELPAFQPALKAQQLYLLDAGRVAAGGDAAAVRHMLESDLAFWRRVLASSDMLITKMLAGAAVRRHFEYGNLALRALPSEQVEAAVPPSWHRPLTTVERSLARTLSGELRFMTGGVRSMSAGGDAAGLQDWLSRPLLQEQATLNRFAGQLAALARASELPYEELGPAVEALSEPPEPLGFQLYNPIGALLHDIAAPGLYARYIAQVSDLEGKRRATLLAATLRADGVAPGQAAAAVEASTLRNPYDGSPFEWDAGRGAVVFNGIAPDEHGEHAARL